MIRALMPPSMLLCLAGCTATDARHFPSLMPRAAEGQGFDEPKALPLAPVADDPALDARIDALMTTVAERTAAFEAAATIAEKRAAAARGTAAGSEAWLNAQTALGDLDVIRADAGEPLTTLDQLALDRAVALGQPYPKLDQAAADARAKVEAMSARIAAIQGALAS